MSPNFAVLLTLSLLALMVSAGVFSGFVGFALGREALKGVTQPDVPPTSKFIQRMAKNPTIHQETVFLRESDILATVKARTEGNIKGTTSPKPTANLASPTASPDATDGTAANPQFPITSQVSGVTMAVRSLRQEGDALVMDVSLKNDSSQSVRFLYSFLTVMDNRGRTLNATASGLPGEIPPQSEEFQGTVKVPTIALDGANSISVTLTDYPEQRIQLQVSGIPVQQ